MRFGIRVSILTLFIALICFIGGLLIAISYSVTKKVLLESAQQNLHIASDNIENQVASFLEVIHLNTNIGGKLIEEGVVNFKDPLAARIFLLKMTEQREQVLGAHFADPQGNFIYLLRDKNNTYVLNAIKQIEGNAIQITYYLDKDGQILRKSTAKTIKYDPRLRPWYLRATQEKKYILSDVYLFYQRQQLGLTASYPVYNDHGNLIGVFSLDVLLTKWSDFISKLLVTPHAFTFVFDQNENLIAAKTVQESSAKGIAKIETISEPWVIKSWQVYKQNPREIFLYKFAGNWYLASYKSISDITGNPWYIAITLPITDITGELNNKIIISILIAMSVLVFGLILVGFFSTSISKPIVKLTQKAIAIKNMDFTTGLLNLKTYIREVSLLQDAFNAMTGSLKSFIRYIPLTLVKKLLATGDIAHVGGESREITLFFADIRGFTSISENMTPQELTSYLSEYFEVITKIILECQGTVDKYIGDGIMAFWAAPSDDPDHALHACEAALAAIKALNELNKHWREAGKPEITIRIGINTGNAVVGNIGSEEKLSYTAMGDAVNLSSRTQDLNKIYGSTIAVTQSTYQLVKDKFPLRLLDRVTVRGKQKAVNVYELLLPDNALYNKVTEYNTLFMRAFILYQHGKWDEAIMLFKEVLNLYPSDRLVSLFIERSEHLKNNPIVGWDGVWHF